MSRRLRDESVSGHLSAINVARNEETHPKCLQARFLDLGAPHRDEPADNQIDRKKRNVDRCCVTKI